jgi:alpha-L-fucosidase
MPRIKWMLSVALLLGVASLSGQDAPSPYVPDPDPLVQQRVAEWQDLKLGLLMHWGPYSQWGIVESWSIVRGRRLVPTLDG